MSRLEDADGVAQTLQSLSQQCSGGANGMPQCTLQPLGKRAKCPKCARGVVNKRCATGLCPDCCGEEFKFCVVPSHKKLKIALNGYAYIFLFV